jgi:hypothetical protein
MPIYEYMTDSVRAVALCRTQRVHSGGIGRTAEGLQGLWGCDTSRLFLVRDAIRRGGGLES